MDKNDVLLTDEEFTRAYEGVTNRTQGYSTRMQAGREAQNKAQCLKLLDVMNKAGLLRCEYTVQIYKSRCYRKTCRRCQIEKLLKDNNND